MHVDELIEALEGLLDTREGPSRGSGAERNFNCEDCVQCSNCRFCRGCVKCAECTYCEDSEDCTGCTQSKRCKGCSASSYLEDCRDCRESRYLHLCVACEACVHCLGCVGLEGAEFHILNERYSRKEYFDILRTVRESLEERLAGGWRPPVIGLETASPAASGATRGEQSRPRSAAASPSPGRDFETDFAAKMRPPGPTSAASIPEREADRQRPPTSARVASSEFRASAPSASHESRRETPRARQARNESAPRPSTPRAAEAGRTRRSGPSAEGRSARPRSSGTFLATGAFDDEGSAGRGGALVFDREAGVSRREPEPGGDPGDRTQTQAAGGRERSRAAPSGSGSGPERPANEPFSRPRTPVTRAAGLTPAEDLPQRPQSRPRRTEADSDPERSWVDEIREAPAADEPDDAPLDPIEVRVADPDGDADPWIDPPEEAQRPSVVVATPEDAVPAIDEDEYDELLDGDRDTWLGQKRSQLRAAQLEAEGHSGAGAHGGSDEDDPWLDDEPAESADAGRDPDSPARPDDRGRSLLRGRPPPRN